ncbi:MAG: hypothetical protein AAGD14_19950 [Planctomycetota bacterium]
MREQKPDPVVTPRRSVGLRHYIPLFYLAPSLALLVYAWFREPTAPPPVFVRIEAEGFEFPRDVRLDLLFGEAGRVPFRGQQASFPRPDGDEVEVQVEVRKPGTVRREQLGSARVIDLSVDPAGPVPYVLTAAECRAVLARLRTVR